jgi:hypothetical protein
MRAGSRGLSTSNMHSWTHLPGTRLAACHVAGPFKEVVSYVVISDNLDNLARVRVLVARLRETTDNYMFLAGGGKYGTSPWGVIGVEFDIEEFYAWPRRTEAHRGAQSASEQH